MTVTLKIGLFTPKHQWIQTPLSDVFGLMGQRIDEPTGIYLSLAHSTDAGDTYRFQPLWDFDDKSNPTRALCDARRFAQDLTKKGIPLSALIPFASGRKGIHIASRHLLAPQDWFDIFALTADRLWTPEFPTLDGGIYKNRAMVRAPWSRHAAVNARKKPIPWDLFWRGTWADIEAWAQCPLNDAQYADIDGLIRECLPTDEPTPAYWRPFADSLVLDFRQHTLTRKAIVAALFFHPTRRFKNDWGAVLDEADVDYRQRKNKNGAYFQLRECPYCHRRDKAYVTSGGFLRCFRTGCSAHEGIPAHLWTEYLGVPLEAESDETSQVADPISDHQKEDLLNASLASARLRQELERIHHLPPGAALLVMSTPGIGKTTHALEQVRRFGGRVIVAAATRERAKELYQQYNRADAFLLQGRCEENCPNYERVSIVGAKGYFPGKVVCPGCPLFPANAKKEGTSPCAYYGQYQALARVLFCTYEQALYLHEADRLDAELIVLDEDPTRAFMRKREIQLPHLQFNSHGLELPVRRFVRFLQHTLAIAAVETDQNPAVYRSQLLVDWLHLSADQLGLDIYRLLSQVQNCISNVYDQPARLAGKAIDELQWIPPAYLLDLAQALREEVVHRQLLEELSCKTKDWNSTLSISVWHGVATLNFYQRLVLQTQTPLVILDAYGRPDYYQALLNRPVETIRVQATIHARVIKVKLATSKRAFRARNDALFKRLDEVMAQHENRKCLIYTHAAIEKEVQRRYPTVATQHFWSGRGKDEFKDYDVVVLFGTAEPNPQELINECRALFASDPVPIDPKPLSQDHRHCADERLETLRVMRREEEMSQAAHRHRPVWAEKTPKTIIVMSHLDLPGLPASEVIDPRAIQSQRRKERFAEFISDCLDQMGFYFDGLAEIAGLVECQSKTASQLRQRLDGTGSVIGDGIRQAVPPSDSAPPLYPANRNAFYRDRGAILKAMELLSAETLTFNLSRGRATIKVWGNSEAALAWLESLVSDRLLTRKPFTLEGLLAVCDRYAIEMDLLLREAPTRADVYYRLFEAEAFAQKEVVDGQLLRPDTARADFREPARPPGG